MILRVLVSSPKDDLADFSTDLIVVANAHFHVHFAALLNSVRGVTMAIDITKEELITFGGLVKILPRRPRGKPTHISTFCRWRFRGLKGIKLEAVRVGGVWMTSMEAFQRFTDRLTAQAEAAEVTLSDSHRRPAHEAADAALEADQW